MTIKTGYRLIGAALAVSLLAVPGAAHAADPAAPVAACATPPPMTGKARERKDGVALMSVAGLLEAQGEADFHLKHSPPPLECLVETFNVQDFSITATYNAFEKGESTLNYRFRIDRPTDDSEILVLSSGLAAVVAGGGAVLHVSEERNGIISWYAMYKEEPPYAVVKDLVTRIAEGTAAPLLAVRWPPGAKEGEVVAFDSKRLK